MIDRYRLCQVGCWSAHLANKFSYRISVNLLKKIISVCSSKIGDCLDTVINGNLGGTVENKDWIILPKSSFSKSFWSHKNRMQHTFACVIALLLLIGGVEVNPGSTVAEISKRLDEFIHSYQAERDQLLLSIPTLSSRLDEHIKDISALVINMNTEITKQEARLLALESSLLMKTKSPCEVQESNVIQNHQSNHGNQASVVYNNLVERMIKNVLEKEKRKCNVVIFNMPDSNSFVDDKQNLSKLTFDLNLDENVIESISRIGRLSTNRHRPLKLQLRNERCASLYLEAAKQLRYMKVNWPKIGISPDRSPDEVKSHQTIMKELRHQKKKIHALFLNDNF